MSEVEAGESKPNFNQFGVILLSCSIWSFVVLHLGRKMFWPMSLNAGRAVSKLLMTGNLGLR